MAVKERKIAVAATPTALPEGWRRVKFGDVVRDVKVTVEPETSGLERYVAGEHMDTDDLHIRRWGTVGDGYLGPAFHRKFVKGQVLYGSRRTYLRKVAVAEFDGVCANTTFVLEPKGDYLLPELLPFIMQTESFSTHAVKQSRGSVNPYVNFRDIAWYEFALPPKDEQRRIAEILWATDELSEQLISVSDDIKKTSSAFWHEEFSKGKWQTVSLGNIADISNGSTPSRKVERYWSNGNIAWLPTGKVHDRIVRKADEYVTADALKECSIRLHPIGSVLIAMIGEGKTRGSVAYLDIEACINQNFACAVPQKGINGWFLFYYLDNCYEQLRNFSHGSNQGALNCRILREFPVQLPPEHEQYRIVKNFQSMDAARERASDHAAKILNLKKQLLSELLNVKQHDSVMVR